MHVKIRGKIGVLYGGDSNERAISLRSGAAIYNSLKKAGVNVVAVDVKKSSRKLITDADIDFAFIALHGKGGEDGTIQRLLNRINIPFTGSDVIGSYNAFNKIKSKRLLKKKKIPIPSYAVINRRNWRMHSKNFSFPVVIKPVADGSSIGVYIVDSYDMLKAKLKTIFKEHDFYLLEEYIVGREITIGVLGTKALPIIELKPKRRFYDFSAKYTKGTTRYCFPNDFSKKKYHVYQKLALRCHAALRAKDFSRVDLIIDKHGRPFVLELNSIPGFTETSLLPKAARKSGMSFEELCLKIIALAQGRKKHGKKKTRTRQ